ncbi:MAG: phosphodiester glycosidase family protein [Clostridia bacterium]|jgi:hypothetical protein|nr:phosphodiester glycosidase family protein [Clostridia bacterium]
MKKFFLLAAVLLCCAAFVPTAASADDSADFLFEDYEEFFEPDIDGGPWVYHSANLTICIKMSYEDNRLCYIADIYIRNNEAAYTGWAHMNPPGRVTELPHVIARRYDAVFGLVGDYIPHRTNDKGVNIRDGIVYFDEDDADVLAVMPSGEMEVYEKGTVSADDLLALGVRDTLAFGPIIVKDGEMTEAVYKHHLKPGNVRTGIGKVEDGHYVAIVTRSRYTFPQYAQLFMRYGCEWVFNLDGGHSAAMFIMGEQVNGHSYGKLYAESTVYMRQRPLSDVLLIGTSELVPGEDEKALYSGSR